jgi:hypothetical protein
MMKKGAQLAFISIFILLSIGVSAQHAVGKMDLYLLIGQSNMAGRGKTDETSQADSAQIWSLNKLNEWQPASDPLHFDKPAVVGVGPGLTFAREIWRSKPDRPIGLIPCAVGGSGIDDWQTGKKHEQTGIYAYDEMLLRVRKAKESGRIKGIIWHQGESDSAPEKSLAYEKKLEAFFDRLRKEIGAKRVPLIIGTLGDFYVASHPGAVRVNEIIEAYARTHKNVYLVSASGLTDLGDKTHFDTKSARELGRRYAEAYLKSR